VAEVALQLRLVDPDPIIALGVEHVRPEGVEAETVKVTVPAKPPEDVTVIEEAPLFATRIAEGVTGPAEILKSPPGTVTETLVVLVRVFGVVPAWPLTVMVNPILGNGLQVTDRVVPMTLSLQPEGTVPAENATLSAKPFIDVVTMDVVCATPLVMRLMEEGTADKVKSSK